MSFVSQSSASFNDEVITEDEETTSFKESFELYPLDRFFSFGSGVGSITSDTISTTAYELSSEVVSKAAVESPTEFVSATSLKAPMRPVVSVPAFTLESVASTLVLSGAKPGSVFSDDSGSQLSSFASSAAALSSKSPTLKYSVAFREIVSGLPSATSSIPVAEDVLGRMLTSHRDEASEDTKWTCGSEVFPAKTLVAVVIQDIDHSTRLGFLIDDNQPMSCLAAAYMKLRDLSSEGHRVILYRKTEEFMLEQLILDLSPKVLNIKNFQVLFSEIRRM